MKTAFKNGQWILALFGVICLVGAAGVMAQRDNVPSAPLAEARDISEAFRNASKQAMPAVVSIETSTKGGVAEVPEMGDIFKGTPFGEQFKNDPRFKQFFGQGGMRRMPRQEGRGSGFVIDPSGVIMTNSHVVRGADKVVVRFQDGHEYAARDIKVDAPSDIAIIMIDADHPLPALPLGDSEAIQVGDWVLAIGSPFGLDMSVTAGIISAKGRGHNITDRAYFLQTDAAVNPGNSGGPLINLKGEVVGINTAISTRSGGYDGVSFAVPINMAKWVSGQLVDHGKVQRAYLGVQIQPVDNDLANTLGTEVGEGALVSDVWPDTPAEKAKLQPGDVIVKMNGHRVVSTPNLQRLVEELEVGKSYPIEIVRDGKHVTLTMVAETMPENFGSRVIPVDDRPQASPESVEHSELGLELQALSPELAEQFGIDSANPQGVVITGVEPDSPGDYARLRPGTIIEKVGSTAVSTPEEFAAAVKEHANKKGVLLHVRFDDRKYFVVLKP